MNECNHAAIPIRANVSSGQGVTIEGMTPLICIFCKYMTYIEFDLDLHLYQNHRMDLVKLPIGRGSLDTRINYAIEEGKRVGINLRALNKEAKHKLGFEYMIS
jgi:hypothetical protein